MLWLAVTLSQGPGTSVTPIDSATDSIVGWVLGFGPLGVIALALAWLLFKGYRLVPPGFETATGDKARADARADLITERDRVVAERAAAEQQRDEAMKVARDLAPLLSTFIASTGALIPILQGIIASRRGGQDP